MPGETAYMDNKRKSEEERGLTTNAKTIVQNPSKRHPWATKAEKNGFVWIHISARKILSQFSKAQGTVIREGRPEVQFKFLAPLTLNEHVTHTWSEYDSIASRLAQKARTAAKVGAEYTALTKTLGNERVLEDVAKEEFAGVEQRNIGQAVAQWVRRGAMAFQGSNIPKVKVDTPLYYENSERRTLTFEVILLAEDSPWEDIVNPVHDLMRYSSPHLKAKGGIDIEFPYMFEVKTHPKEFINYTTLALTGVQPTWNSPYIYGVPSSCNLQLTFRDMSPLYRDTIKDGSVISVVNKFDSEEKLSKEELTVIQVQGSKAALAGIAGARGGGATESFDEKQLKAKQRNQSDKRATGGKSNRASGGGNEGDYDAI